MTTRLSRRAGLVTSPARQTAACDYCGHTFATADLEWTGVKRWVTPDGDRGEVTGTFCAGCRGLALDHCWRCGLPTGQTGPDAVCAACEVSS